MSFRHTYITEYLYKHGRQDELDRVRALLEKHGTVHWNCSANDPQLGYFHGIIKDLNGLDVSGKEGPELISELDKMEVIMKIVYE